MQVRRILVTGGAGSIGENFVQCGSRIRPHVADRANARHRPGHGLTHVKYPPKMAPA